MLAAALTPRQAEGRPVKVLATLRGSFTAALARRLDAQGKLSFPAVEFAQDPCGFADKVLGVRVWDKQRELIEAVRDHDRVSVKASNKISKTHSAGILALWWCFCRPEGRVIFLSPTYRQSQGILYRQILQLIWGSGLCCACREEDPQQPKPCPHSAVLMDHARVAMLADTGIQCDDFRSIQGFSATDTSSIQGISAANNSLLFILDEACFINDSIYDGVERNAAGGASILAISNPIVQHGWWYQTWHKNAEFWHKIHLSSVLHSPNVLQRRIVVSGLATYEYVERRRKEWGEESFQFVTGVLGEFSSKDESRMFPFQRVQEACDRWDDAIGEGPLRIGLDPAGASDRADEIVAAFVRGRKLLDIQATRSLDAEQLVEWLVQVSQRWREPSEVPELRLDVEGAVGSQVLGMLRAHEKLHPGSFRLIPLASSDNARRNKKAFGTLRDELANGVEEWVKTGALIDDPLLLEDLAVMEWSTDVKGRNRLISKTELKQILGSRSPDRYDALALACHESGTAAQKAAMEAQAARRQAGAPGRVGSPDRQWRAPEKKSTRSWYGR